MRDDSSHDGTRCVATAPRRRGRSPSGLGGCRVAHRPGRM